MNSRVFLVEQRTAYISYIEKKTSNSRQVIVGLRKCPILQLSNFYRIVI